MSFPEDNKPELEDKVLRIIDALLGGRGHILELGSGLSSVYFADKGYKVTAVEHNEEWLNRHPAIDYIYAPIVYITPSKSWEKRFGRGRIIQWYCLDALKKGIKGKKFDLMIIDGPPASVGREGLWFARDLFDWNFPIIFDDVERAAELRLFVHMSSILKNEFGLVVSEPGKRSFSILLQNREQALKAMSVI